MKCKEIQEKENVNLQLLNKKKVEKLKEKGITLISLVVTIIILLILVGVTVSQITGENGLIKRSREAVGKYKNTSEKEQIQIGQLEQYVNDFEVLGKNKDLLEAEDTDVLEGKTYIGKNGESIGIMKDYSGEIVETSEITNDGKSTTIMIPNNGFYNTESKINILNNSLSKFFNSSCRINSVTLERVNEVDIGSSYTFTSSTKCTIVVAFNKNNKKIDISLTKNGSGSVINQWSDGCTCWLAIQDCVKGDTSVELNGNEQSKCGYLVFDIDAETF